MTNAYGSWLKYNKLGSFSEIVLNRQNRGLEPTCPGLFGFQASVLGLGPDQDPAEFLLADPRETISKHRHWAEALERAMP